MADYKANAHSPTSSTRSDDSSNKKGRKRRSHNSKKGKTDLYGPHPECRGQGNIFISRRMTEEIVPKFLGNVKDIYRFMEKLVFTGENTKPFGAGDIQIVNYGFGYGFPRYCIMDRNHRINEAGNRNYKWKMRDGLFTAEKILGNKQISVERFEDLPRSIDIKQQINTIHVRIVQELKRQIYEWLSRRARGKTIFNKTSWCKLPVFANMDHSVPDKKGCSKKRQLLMNKLEFLESLEDFARDHCDDIALVPIMRFDPNKKSSEYWIEYVWIVNIDEYMDIGISVAMNNGDNNIEITGIHCDKDSIINHHQLCLPNHHCTCLKLFRSIFHEIRIGNIDGDQNKLNAKEKEIKRLQRKIDELKKKLKDRQDPDAAMVDENDVFQMNGGYTNNGIFQGISNSTAHSMQSSDGQVNDSQLNQSNNNIPIIGHGYESATPSIPNGNNNIGYNNLLSPQPSQLASPTVSTPNHYGSSVTSMHYLPAQIIPYNYYLPVQVIPLPPPPLQYVVAPNVNGQANTHFNLSNKKK